MMYRTIMLTIAALSTTQASAGDLSPSVYVAPGGVYIGSAQVFVTPGPKHIEPYAAPTYDPNLFSQRMATKEGRAEYNELLQDPSTPLINRAIQGRFPPGSTWKIPMAVSGLKQGAITIEHSNLLCGGGITIGNKFTRCMGNHGSPPLSYAITKSCDGYYYRLGMKMGIEGIIQMIETFGYDKRSGIDLPNEKVPQTPKSWMPYILVYEIISL